MAPRGTGRTACQHAPVCLPLPRALCYPDAGDRIAALPVQPSLCAHESDPVCRCPYGAGGFFKAGAAERYHDHALRLPVSAGREEEGQIRQDGIFLFFYDPGYRTAAAAYQRHPLLGYHGHYHQYDRRDTGIRSLSGFQAGRVLDIGPSKKVGTAFAAAMIAAINS